MIGKRVKVKDTTTHQEDTLYVQRRAGLTGVVKTRAKEIFDWDVDGVGAFYTDELIVLGGAHAGDEHPENWADVPTDIESARAKVHWAAFDSKHGHAADMDAELDAWREGVGA